MLEGRRDNRFTRSWATWRSARTARIAVSTVATSQLLLAVAFIYEQLRVTRFGLPVRTVSRSLAVKFINRYDFRIASTTPGNRNLALSRRRKVEQGSPFDFSLRPTLCPSSDYRYAKNRLIPWFSIYFAIVRLTGYFIANIVFARTTQNLMNSIIS